MKKIFNSMITDIECKFDLLKSSSGFTLEKPTVSLPDKGVYCFLKNGKALYVGRSNNIKRRFRNHISDSHNQATFAFLLARHETGLIKPSYKKKGSRSDMLKDPIFKKSFDKFRMQISRMTIKVVEERDPTKQALLEIYTAVVLKAKYNSFDNH